MARIAYICHKCSEFHLNDEPCSCQKHGEARANFPAPQHIRDDLGIKGVLNHADGKKYDSYSAYKKAVKANNCEIVGDKPITPFKPHRVPKAGADIKAAIEQLKSR